MIPLILALLLPVYTDSTMRETVKTGEVMHKDSLYWVKTYPCYGRRFVACEFGDPALRGRYLCYDDKLCEMYYSTKHFAYYNCQLYAWDTQPMSWDSVVAGMKQRQAAMLKGKYKYSFIEAPRCIEHDLVHYNNWGCHYHIPVVGTPKADGWAR